MSLEQSIDGLALAINALAQALTNREPQQAPEEPKTRKPRATKTAAEEAQIEAAADKTEEPAKAYTLDDVREALVALKDKDDSRDRCIEIIKRHTGREVLTGCPESAFAAIIKDTQVLLA